MKLSKALLGAIMVGVSLQTTVSLSSCTKKDKETLPVKQHADKTPDTQPSDSCPACGMG
jgi:hypothetical protein